MAHPFVVGQEYFDRIGNFVVLSIEQGKMRIRYDDGTEQTGDIQVKATIYQNILGEQRNLHPYQSAAYFESLGSLARYGDFQAEVPDQAQHGFEGQYAIFTNGIPTLGVGGYYPVRTVTRDDKWGPELRIYFPDRLQPMELPPGIEIRSGSADGIVRINNNRFWWQLVRTGFRLGVKHDKKKIRDSIPPHFQGDFDRALE
jgi:hypothetical protein